ncbi:hypothetical protein A9977_03175 [Variovorax sp. UMC13]|nr:hypothetical protein [Variovorax sp. UMC13]
MASMALCARNWLLAGCLAVLGAGAPPARLSGNSRWTSRAAACTCCSVTPASTSIVLLTGSMARTRFSRASESTSARPLSSGVAPPDRPVLPPCGTTGTRWAWHQRTMAATSCALSGWATAQAAPVHFRRQSVRKAALSLAALRSRPEKASRKVLNASTSAAAPGARAGEG